VASWHGHIDRGDLGDVLFRLGHLYNTALVTVERQGGWGLTPLNVLKRRGYPRIHRRKEEGKKRERRTVRLGFDMTETNRALVLDALA
jgi:DNA-binding transcriptional ArsR family regulator